MFRSVKFVPDPDTLCLLQIVGAKLFFTFVIISELSLLTALLQQSFDERNQEPWLVGEQVLHFMQRHVIRVAFRSKHLANKVVRSVEDHGLYEHRELFRVEIVLGYELDCYLDILRLQKHRDN